MAQNQLLSKCAAALLAAATLLSGIAPVDRFTWGLELAALGGVGLALLIARSRGFVPSPPTAWILWVYAFVMLIGAHWTYGQAPPGEWLQSLFGLQRNPWDRVGHLFQGALPALAMIDFATHTQAKKPQAGAGPVFAGLATCAFFETCEWLAALTVEGDFVQAQGDRFDTPNDFLFAFIGAALATALTSRRRASSE